MSTLLITGGAGFIGSNLVRHALAHTSDRLVVVDKLTYAGSLLNLEGPLKDPRVVFVRADIADRDADGARVRRAPPGRDPEPRGRDPRRSVDRQPAALHRHQHRRHVRAARGGAGCSWRRCPATPRAAFRFLHVSTDEVYGTLGPSGLFSEETPYAPNSPYAASKAAADHLVRAYFHTYGLPVVITNCSNNYGPFQFPEKLIPLMILNALDGRALPIYGDGGNVRDWLHVDDHCAGLLLVLRKGRLGEKYNIGGGNERTNLEIVDRVCDALEALAARGVESGAGGRRRGDTAR